MNECPAASPGLVDNANDTPGNDAETCCEPEVRSSERQMDINVLYVCQNLKHHRKVLVSQNCASSNSGNRGTHLQDEYTVCHSLPLVENLISRWPKIRGCLVYCEDAYPLSDAGKWANYDLGCT